MFFNGIGGFSSDTKEYVFRSSTENEVPLPWSNVLANKNFGTIVTDNFGGFSWYKNSRLNRITSWNNDATIDLPSEIFYMKDLDKNNYYSICTRVANDSSYIIKHGQGYSELMQVCNDILHNIVVYVEKNNNRKRLILTLKNLKGEKRKLKLYYYLDFLLGEDMIKTSGNVLATERNGIVYLKNIFSNQFGEEVIISSNTIYSKVIYGKTNFFGKDMNVGSPKYIIQNEVYKLQNKIEGAKTDGVAIEFDIDLEAFSSKEIELEIGIKEELEDSSYKETLQDQKQFWNSMLGNVYVKTPDEKLNVFINSWCMYQIISSRLLAKSGYYQSGGAIGSRDQIQDALAAKYVDSNILKEYIFKLASHQFEEGDVLHWWHEENNLGVRTKFSDDYLWLVYATCEYIEFTGDISILDEEISYLKDELLEDDESERCKEYTVYGIKESLFRHCVRAVERAINLGKDNLPLIGSGDWNDGFSNIGHKGVGESVWLGFFLYDILSKFEPILNMKGEEGLLEKSKLVRDKIKKAINIIAWDGMWYVRAITDSGDVIGSKKNRECMIDSISQAWSVISDAGEKEKQYTSMYNVKKYLIDKENKIFRLLYPSFKEKEFMPGYISRYKDGIRENAGQYTHGILWSIKAFILLGEYETAYELIDMINPITHGENESIIKTYKIEPYVIAGDVYANKDMLGRGGWSWYTGAAGWFYKIIIEDLLGVKIKNDILEIKPHIPSSWNEFSINFTLKESNYIINARKNMDANLENPIIKVNGVVQESGRVKMEQGGYDFTIDIEM